MIPYDLTAIIEKGLSDGHRPRDSYLHASSDIVGSLRHSQLGFVGAPTLQRDLVSDIRLRTGTMWHTYIGNLLLSSGIPVLQEVNLTPWMPEGWSGTADWLFWVPEYEAFTLRDLKTSKGEALQWKERDGMSTEHLHQASLYWHAAVEAGFPMLDVLGVYYLPMNAVAGEDVSPVMIESKPLEKDYLWPLLEERYEAAMQYAADVCATNPDGEMVVPNGYDSEFLAPEQDRVQKLFWNKAIMGWDVKLVPHWTAQFCLYPDELCACDKAGSTKVGHWTVLKDGELFFDQRKGYDVEPEIEPSRSEIKRRLK